MTGLETLALQTPLWGMAVLPLALALVALYTIRSKPRVQTLPSLRLWRMVLAKKRPNSFLSRWRNSLFLLLQLLVLLAAALALARPVLDSDTGGDVVVVVDTSASMGAVDGRFEAAKDQARALLDRLDPGARAALVAAGPEVRVAVPMTGDRGALRAALAGLEVSPGPATPPRVLLAAIVGARTEDTRVAHVFGDSWAASALGAGVPGARVLLHHVGKSAENVGVTRLDVRPRGGAFQVAALVRNFSAAPAKVEASLLAAGPPKTQVVEVPPLGREQIVLFDGARPDQGLLGVKVRVRAGPTDRLAADDVAQAAPRRGAVKVLLLSTAPEPIQRALELISAVQVEARPPGALAGMKGELDGYDLVVAEGVWDPALAGRRLLLFHGPGASALSTGQAMVAPEQTGQDGTHPVMRYLNLQGVLFQAARHLDKVVGARPLLQSTLGPLLVATAEGEARQVLAGFTLSECDLADGIAFPILLTNSVRWLLEDDSRLKGQFRVGQALRVEAGTRLEVTPPGGAPEVLRPEGQGRVEVRPFRTVGVHQVREGPNVALPYPVNLLDPGESDLSPRGEGSEEVGTRPEAGEGSGTRRLWRLLLGVALALLVAEWVLLAVRGGAS